MIKKFLILILTVMLALSANFVYADDSTYYSESELKTFESSLEFYMHFGITDKKSASSTVTRREFAKAAEAYFYGNSGAQLTAFFGSDEKPEELDKDITLEEALKCMAAGLGYGRTGGDYVSIAYNLGVAKGIAAEQSMPVTFFNVIKMLDNALEIKLVESSLPGDGSYMLTDNTVLSRVFKLERKKGVVTAVSGTSLTSLKVGKNYVAIDGEKYETDCAAASNLVGCRVDYYVDVNNYNFVKFIGSTSKYNTVTEYDADEIDSYANRKYTISYDDDKQKYISLDDSAFIMYNGRPAANTTAGAMVPKIGRVVFIDNNNDGNAEVVSVYSFDIKIISTVDDTNNRIYFKDGSKTEADKYEYFTITQNGAPGELPLKSLKAETAVYTGESDKDGMLIEILPISITGKTEALNDDDIKIDGKVYELADNAYYENEVRVGDTATFWLDGKNRVAAVMKVNTQLHCGFLVNAAEDDGIADVAEVKLFDDYGQMRILKTAVKINVDGQSMNYRGFLETLKKGGNEVQPQLVYFSVNEKSELKKVDTAYNYSVSEDYRNIIPTGNDSESSFRLVYSSTLQNEGQLIYFPRMKTFDGYFGGSGSQKVFVIPDSPKTADNKDFKLMSLNTLLEAHYNVDAYAFDSDNFTPDAYVVHGKNASGMTSYVGVVADIIDTIDKDGEQVQRIILCGPTDRSFEFDLLNYNVNLDSVPAYYNAGVRYKLDKGDIAAISYSNGELVSAEMILDTDSGSFNGNYSQYGRYWRIDYGAVYRKNGSMISIAPPDKLSEIETLKAQLETAADSEKPLIKNKIAKIERGFIVYCTSDFRQVGIKLKDNGKKKITSNPKTLYIPYSDNTENYTKVLVHSSEAYAWTMFTYEQ